MQPQTDVDKLQAHILAPSASLNEESILAVAGALLGAQFIDANEFRKCVFASAHQETTCSTSSSQPEFSSPSVFTTVYSRFEESMLGIREKEASSIPLLAVFALTIIEKLNKRFVGLTFHADMEYVVMVTPRAGVNPACDTAIVITTDAKSIILYESKPVVDPRSDFVNKRCLLEGLLQGFYCLHYKKVKSIIQCLHTWSFMKLNKHSNQIRVEWYKSIHQMCRPMSTL